MNANETLQRDVVEHLEWSPAVDASSIGVTAKDGVVTLSGFVPSFAEKHLAVRLAQKVRGVRGIADELEVALPLAMERTDSEIAAMVVKALEWDVNVPHDRIWVTVHEGHVKLEGELEWQFQRQAATKAILKLSGVKSIQNHITIKNRATPKDIKGSIVAALHRSAQDDAGRIGVEVSGNTVTLSGTVHTYSAREEAEDAAWAADGVREVHNRILVKPSSLVY
ncbi:MAG: BON domain-containing protein [Meiothermus sp.]|nr:BON domain-containing protein [Meiothermus sp.]